MLRSFVRASVAATRRALAWSLDDLSPPKEQTLFKFATQNDLNKWVVYCDSEHGGLSSGHLELIGDESTMGVFTGDLSLKLADEESFKIKRSGFCGIRTTQVDGKFDLEPFDTIALRLKGDGRCYMSTLRTESWVAGPAEMGFNSWHAAVFAPKNEWYEVMIPFERYLPTWRGKVIDSKTEMNPARIIGMGLSLTAEAGPEGAVSGPGEFRLELDWIKALRCQGH